MTVMRLPYAKPVRVKGRTYWYHRLTRERLPEDAAERAARVLRINLSLDRAGRAGALAKGSAKAGAQAGTFAALIADYRASAEFAALAPGSRRIYDHFLARLADLWGALPVAGLSRGDILHARDALAPRTAQANYWLAVLRLLLAFAVARGWLAANPAAGIARLRRRAQPHARWSEADVAAVLKIARPETAAALMLGLYTGQRLGDVLAMSWADIDGTAIRVVQGKTGARLWIPLATPLRRALARISRTSPLIIASAAGGPLSRAQFDGRWRREVRAAGLAGLTFHGLRHTMASRLAESGAGADAIMAVLGHASPAQAGRYTAQADQRRLADAAITSLENASRKIHRRSLNK